MQQCLLAHYGSEPTSTARTYYCGKDCFLFSFPVATRGMFRLTTSQILVMWNPQSSWYIKQVSLYTPCLV